jgi:methionine synthase I (cobalamin-dependent)
MHLAEVGLKPDDSRDSSVTIETTGTMLLGSDIAAVVNALKPFPIATRWASNCATGPVEMAEHVAYIAKNWDRAISVLPNAGLPILVDGRTGVSARCAAVPRSRCSDFLRNTR